jgi:hypothetical protein
MPTAIPTSNLKQANTSFNVGMTIGVSGNLFEFMGKNVILSPRLKKKFSDFTPFWKQQKPVMQENFTKVWQLGQSEWQPLSANYVRWKRSHGYSTKINIMTGRMRKAMLDGQLFIQMPFKMVWGIDGMSSEWMPAGRSRPYPQDAAEKRPFALLLGETIAKITERFGNYFMKILNKRGDQNAQ